VVTETNTAARRPRYAFWLLASVPFALLLDIWVLAFGRFAYCGLAYCRNHPGDIVTPVVCLCVAGFLVFLAVVLPPWIPGWRRPVIAAAAGAVVALAGSVYAFLPV
jgi:hypothetical protein